MAWTNECRSNVGASEGDKSGRASAGSGGFIQRAKESQVYFVLPQTSLWLLRGWEGGFQPLGKEVQP